MDGSNSAVIGFTFNQNGGLVNLSGINMFRSNFGVASTNVYNLSAGTLNVTLYNASGPYGVICTNSNANTPDGHQFGPATSFSTSLAAR